MARLRLKTTAADYIDRLSTFDEKMSELDGIITEYEGLKQSATKVLGDKDSNIVELRNTIEINIKAARGAYNLLKEARAELQKEMDQMEILSQEVSNLFQQAGKTAQSTFNVIKAVGDAVL